MAGQDPKGDQSPGRASGRTQGLEQGLPGIKAPPFLHGWVVGGFLGWLFVGWVVGWGVVVCGGGGAGMMVGWWGGLDDAVGWGGIVVRMWSGW